MYQEGDLVWAKMSGYPWWPSLVVSEECVSEDVLKLKKKDSTLIRFYADNHFGWMKNTPKEIVPFRGPHFKEYSSTKNAKVKKALEEALALEKDSGLTPMEEEKNAEPTPEKQPKQKKRKAEDGEQEPKKKAKKDKKDKKVEKKEEKKERKPKEEKKEKKAKEERKPKEEKEKKPKEEKKEKRAKEERKEKREKKEKKSKEEKKEKKERKTKEKKEKRAKKDKGDAEQSPKKRKKRIKASEKDIQEICQQLENHVMSGDMQETEKLLRRLSGMSMSLEVLLHTGIGKMVKKLSKSSNKKVADLALGVMNHIRKVIKREGEKTTLEELNGNKSGTPSQHKTEDQPAETKQVDQPAETNRVDQPAETKKVDQPAETEQMDHSAEKPAEDPKEQPETEQTETKPPKPSEEAAQTEPPKPDEVVV